MGYRGSISPSGTAKVRRKTALSLSPLSLDVDEGDTVAFTGKLSEASGPNVGTGVSAKTIHFFVDGSDTGVSAVTDANGDFSLGYVWSVAGDYKYDVRYFGD